VAVAAGVDDMVDAGLLTLDEVRAAIGVYADGARLMKVVGTNRRSDVAHLLAAGAIESYIDSVRANEVSDATVAIDFLQQKLPEYEAAVTDVEQELATWVAEHPDPRDGNRPIDQQVELEGLQDAVGLRRERLTGVETSIEQQELAVEQKEEEVRQRLEVIDPPQEPFAPQPTLKKMVITVGMALVLGCLLALGAVVIGTILDRTIRFPGDVKERLDTRVLAVVPKTRLTSAMRKKLEVVASEPRTVTLTSADREDVDPREGTPATSPDPADDAAAARSDLPGRTAEQAARPLAGAWLKRVN